MSKLEELQPLATVSGIVPNGYVTVVSVQWHGSEAIELTYKTDTGRVANRLIYRNDEPAINIVDVGRPWSFDGDGHAFRLVSEAQRIRLAHLFDPVLAVHTSDIQPLPHQITAVYESMLPRQPLRFLLADDPGAGKTIMAGLLMKELIARGDLMRCLVVCPGSLAEQWQDELYRKFNLPFEILTNDRLETARTGNWFLESNLVIARLDKLSRDESVQERLKTPDAYWDLIVCDEAHKMSASFFGGEIKHTKRYRLGQLLSTLTRNFLLMTATPHNGKEEDFQLFMALLDGDRFEGRFRDGVHVSDTSDMMRRMVKESLLTFDATPLFPERIAHTIPYKLSGAEAELYAAVTDYVREEFNRVEALQNNKRAGTVGFALTILQRRLASSPEAIYHSLRRRRERLESWLREMEVLLRGGQQTRLLDTEYLDEDDYDFLDEAPDNEVEDFEDQILDQATAANSVAELKAEIATLKTLEAKANSVRNGGEDVKWRELADLLNHIFSQAPLETETEARFPSGIRSPRQKLVIFTEHRDTLNYLERKIAALQGPDAIVIIHGSKAREDRMNAQESFRHDPRVQILLATDAAGEGINLQRAHLMVNYDLPWNPNRLEQRFGRIHRIGQKEVCHLWNLVADETREGDVYRRLLEKLEAARSALGGQVFDVLGKVQFEGKSLRELLIEAIRYGEQPDIRARLHQVMDTAFDPSQLRELLEERALARDSMDTSRVHAIKEQMERAEARRLQPHYIESFFLEAFQKLGGSAKEREPQRFEVTHVPAPVRNRDRVIGIGEAVQPRYERIVFDKQLVAPDGFAPGAFVCPGHPLLDSVIDLTIERHRGLLRNGTVLVDDTDHGTRPRVLFFVEHSIQDASRTRTGENRTISKRILYIEIDSEMNAKHLHYAPYLDFRPLTEADPPVARILDRPELGWITRELEQHAQSHAIRTVVPEHLEEVRAPKLDLISRTEAAVKARLTTEIAYWDHRAEDLKAQEQAGRPNARLNSDMARRNADELQGRLQRRLAELALEREISPLPPHVLGGMLVVPVGLIHAIQGKAYDETSTVRDTLVWAARAREIVMAAERNLGFEPVDREHEKLGYDIESRVPGTGKLRFIEVKGRYADADTVTVTKNEILYSLNKPDDFILAIVAFDGKDSHRLHYVRQPFRKEPDFGVTSVNYNLSELIDRGGDPF